MAVWTAASRAETKAVKLGDVRADLWVVVRAFSWAGPWVSSKAASMAAMKGF